jgi:hypothetical protein
LSRRASGALKRSRDRAIAGAQRRQHPVGDGEVSAYAPTRGRPS